MARGKQSERTRLRRLAGGSGARAIRMIVNAIYPVYEGDTETYTEAAVALAAEAWHYAQLAEASRNDGQA